MNGKRTISSRARVLESPNIDTDQIIPARYLTTTTRGGLGRYAFADRRGADGDPLRDPALDGSSILVAGDNFGCGSSREHAAWALHDFGIRAVISTSIADIFTSNALRNEIAPIEVTPDDHAWLCANGANGITIDLEAQTIDCAGRRCSFTIDPFGRRCLLEGIDAMDAILQHAQAIREYEEHPRWTR